MKEDDNNDLEGAHGFTSVGDGTIAGATAETGYWKAQRRLDLLRMAHDITRDEDPDRLIRTAERFEAWSEGKPQP